MIQITAAFLLLQIGAGITSWSKLLQIRTQQLGCMITKENLFQNVFQCLVIYWKEGLSLVSATVFLL